MSAASFFDAARLYKRELTGNVLGGLDQADVDALNAVVARWKPSEATPHPQGTLQPSRACYDLIKAFEGYAERQPDGSVKAYPDPATGGAPWTIGYGSTGPDIKPGTRWSQQQAEARLIHDVSRFATGVATMIGNAQTDQCEFDAMVCLAYNIGLGNFGNSTLLKKHKAGDKTGAAAEFARWNKAAGKVMAGLTRRREAEAKLYRGGQ